MNSDLISAKDQINVDEFKRQVASAIKIAYETIRAVFGSKGGVAINVLRSLIISEIYRHHNMEVYAHWRKTAAVATYRLLAKFGANGFGALERCCDMLSDLMLRSPIDSWDEQHSYSSDFCGDPISSLFNSYLGTESLLLRVTASSVESLSCAIWAVEDEMFKSDKGCVRSAISALLESFELQKRRLYDQSDLKLATADFNLAKVFKAEEQLKYARKHAKQLAEDILTLVSKIDLEDYKELLRLSQLKSSTEWFCVKFAEVLGERYGQNIANAHERMRKESLAYRLFRVLK